VCKRLLVTFISAKRTGDKGLQMLATLRFSTWMGMLPLPGFHGRLATLRRTSRTAVARYFGAH
jgi:hypothetical protein